MSRRILVTGGCGFVGANLVRHLLETTDAAVVNLDLLTYAGNPENLAGVAEAHGRRYRFVRGDICDAEAVRGIMRDVDVVIHLAAESHVDRSIASDAPFVRTNVAGTQNLLSAAVEAGVERFVHVSTDEVYGELPWRDPGVGEGGAEPRDSGFTEDSPLAPRSPYAASKAGSDLLVSAYHATHGLDVVVTRCSNNYGPYQFPEKLIPLVVTRALQGGTVPVYGDGLHVRDWIHVEDHCRGLVAALERGRTGAVYNLGGESERTNLHVVRAILAALDVSADAIRFVEDRPGHDRRYAVDIARARRELDWEPTVDFDTGLRDTVAWYVEHRGWWERIRSGSHRAAAATDAPSTRGP